MFEILYTHIKKVVNNGEWIAALEKGCHTAETGKRTLESNSLKYLISEINLEKVEAIEKWIKPYKRI